MATGESETLRTPFNELSDADRQLAAQLLTQYNALRSEIVAYTNRQASATRLTITALLTVAGLMLAAQRFAPDRVTPELRELIRGVGSIAAIATVLVWIGIYNFAMLLIHELGAYARLIEQHLNHLWGRRLFVWDTLYINRLSGRLLRGTWWLRVLPAATQLFPIVFIFAVSVPAAWQFVMSALNSPAAWTCVLTASAIISVNVILWPFIPLIVHRKANRVNQELFNDVWHKV